MNGYASVLEVAKEKLDSKSEESRYQGVKMISRVNLMGAVPLLLRTVGDESYRVREEALRGVCSFPAEIILPRLEVFLRNHDEANLRTAALEAFPRYGREAATYLLRLLQDWDEEVRMFTATLLGEILDSRAVEPLIAALKDPDENVRHAAVESLGKLKDPRAVNPLLECFSEDFWIKYPAVIALGNIGDPLAVGPLTELLSDEMLQQAVIESLGDIGDPAAIPILAGLLARNDPVVRNDTIAALVRIQLRNEKESRGQGVLLSGIKETLEGYDLVSHLLRSLKDQKLEVRKNAVIALGWLGEERAVPDLVELLREYHLEEYVIGSLVSIGEGAVPVLAETLRDPEARVRASCIRCLNWIGGREGVLSCLPSLQDPDPEVRQQALLAVAQILDDEEVEEKLLSLAADPDPEFRNILVEIAGRSRSPRLPGKLIGLLRNGGPEKRIAAVRILGRLRDPQAFLPLQELIQEANDELRAEVYRALSVIGPEKISTEILISGLSDQSPTVRKAATQCLAQGSGENAEARLILFLQDQDPEIRLAAVETLGRIGSFACVPPLLKAFSLAEKRIQMAVVQVLGRISTRAGTDFLIELLRESDSDLKRAALEALGELREGRAMPGLIVALDDPNWIVRAAAIVALRKLGDRRCIPHLGEKLNDPEDLIKKEAIAALADLGGREAVNRILPLVHNENLQLEVLNAVEKLGIPDLEFFFIFLQRCNSRMRGLLIDRLGRLKDSLAVDYLLNLFADEFFTVRVQVAKVLGEIGNKKALPVLLKAQREDPSEEVRKEAARALRKLDVHK